MSTAYVSRIRDSFRVAIAHRPPIPLDRELVVEQVTGRLEVIRPRDSDGESIPDPE